MDISPTGDPGLLASGFVLVLGLQAAVGLRTRPEGWRWIAVGYVTALACVVAHGEELLFAQLGSRVLVTIGIARYVGFAVGGLTAVGAAAVATLVMGSSACIWALVGLDALNAMACALAARRSKRQGHGLLAVGFFGSAVALAVGSIWGAQEGAFGRLAWLTSLAVGAVIPVACLLRSYDLALASQPAMQRMMNFYDALSRTNQAIARTKDRQALFDAICEICVDAGHARMACVYVLDGNLAHRLATAGPASEILSGIPQPWDISEQGARRSYTVEALTVGRPLVSNDYQNDPRAAPWRELAIEQGVKAFAWLPFHRRGGVEGVLMLAAGSAHFFDELLIKLLDKMVGDISLALDAIDQERARDQAQREAVAGMERFQLLFNAAPIPTSIISIAERRVLAVNDSCCTALGADRDQLVGRKTQELDSRLSDKDREDFYAELRHRGRVRNRLIQVHLPSGAAREELFNAEPIEYLGQACLLVMSQDVTAFREAKTAREELARSKEANRAKTEFLARMSHELRTPLNAVLGFAELVRRDAEERLTSQEQSQLDLVLRAGWHLTMLINDVLDMSRVESGQMAVSIRAVALAPLLDEVLQMKRVLADRQSVSLQALYRGAPPLFVLADPTRLRQVVLNMVSNAIKYNRPGGRVCLAIDTDGDRVSMVVEDSGLGMTREQMAHLFEPFNRLGRERSAVEGTGIGLVLTRHLLRLMDGDLDIESEAGVGTRVKLWLPRADASEGGVAAEQGVVAEGDAATPHGTVLYIEDNDVNALLVEQLIARWSRVRFVHAADGQSGMDLAKQICPDLLLLDMHLPDLDGLEVLRRLRADPATRRIRVVALSASAAAEDVERALELGADNYWTKPLAVSRFLADVARLLSEGARESRPS